MVDKKEEKPKIKLSEILELGSDFNLPLLSEINGQTITIEEVAFKKGKFGEYAVIRTTDGKKYRTANEVVLNQLKDMQKYLEKYTVEATVKKVKNYYILA